MAAFASAPPDPLVPAPDPQDALIQAVQAGDGAAVSRWLQRWVHRRGVASLEPLVARVASLQGPEAAGWLRRQLETPVAAGTAAAVVPPAASDVESPAEPATAPETSPEPSPEPVVAFEPPPAPPAFPDPTPTPEPVAVAEPAQPAQPPLPAAEDGQDAPAAPAALEFPPLEFELPSFELPPLDSPSTTSPERSSAPASAPEAGSAVPPLPQEWSLDLEAAFPPLGTAARTSPSDQETPAVSDPAVASDADHEADPAPGSRRRGAFARMKSLVRGCLEEAREALHRFDAVELDDVEGEEEFLAATEEPEQQPLQPGQTALPEIPSFLAEGAAAPPSQGTGTAAPAPSALSDLRGWLPEPEDQLPRAS